MPPKTAKQLQEQIELENSQRPAKKGHSRTAEGLETPDPTRSDFFTNVEKASRGERKQVERPEAAPT